MITPFTVSTDDRGDGVAVLLVSGELDETTCDEVVQAIGDVLRPGIEVIVDLRHLEFMGAHGVRALLVARATAVEVGCRLRLTNAAGLVLRMLEIAGVAEMFGVGGQAVRSDAQTTLPPWAGATPQRDAKASTVRRPRPVDGISGAF